jgi:hypothetical protein
MGFGLVIRFIEPLNNPWLHFTISLTHRLVFSVTVFTALLGYSFQWWIFPFLEAPELSSSSATSFCNSQLTDCLQTPPHRLNDSRLSLYLDWQLMTAGPRYIASAWTARRTLLAAVPPLLHGHIAQWWLWYCCVLTKLLPSNRHVCRAVP